MRHNLAGLSVGAVKSTIDLVLGPAYLAINMALFLVTQMECEKLTCCQLPEEPSSLDVQARYTVHVPSGFRI